MTNMLQNSRFWLALGTLSATTTSLYLARTHAVTPAAAFSLAAARPAASARWLMLLTFALLNLKHLPFAWHLRLLRGLLAHASLRRSRRPPSPGPRGLFLPLITSTRCALLDLDYNLHKSNSTYFADLDISRMHLVACILQQGLHKANFDPPPEEEVVEVVDGVEQKKMVRRRKKVGIYLGGVACWFRKEVPVGQAYEIWTRVLAWDRKWLYLVSHIVKKGAVKPKGYQMQPWKTVKPAAGRKSKENGTNGSANGSANGHANGHASYSTLEPPHPAIIATSIAKYVFKDGRKTLPPEDSLAFSGLLPPKPEGAKGAADPEEEDDEIALNGDIGDDSDEWTWERVERERRRGMRLAKHYAALDGLNGEFKGDETEALGEW